MRVHWSKLRHNGPAFPEPYRREGFSVKIKGREVSLNELAEEMVYAWAKKKDTQYVKDPVFAANLLDSLRPHLPQGLGDFTISDIDFSEPFALVEEEKAAKLSHNKEEKREAAAARKKMKQELKDLYGYAYVDDKKVEVANWMLEPPGLFMGRGAHPLRGSWKPKVMHGEVTLNLDAGAPVPRGGWCKVVHDHSAIWFASWRDHLTGKVKYVYPSESTSLRQERDKAKYDRALKLRVSIERVRRRIEKMLSSRNQKDRKIATVCYLIDNLALRVGDEKDSDEADTVGATTLRVEHIGLNGQQLSFDFLGKDSVRWQKSIEQPHPQALRNFKEFIEGKEPKEQVFDGVTSNSVNRFLGRILPGLTTKVFRTFRTTKVIADNLKEADGALLYAPTFLKIHRFKLANLEAAAKCNHKRARPKNWEESLQKKEQKLRSLRSESPKTEKATARLKERTAKIESQIELAKETLDYSLNTSLKNYIDPRVVKTWAANVGLDWKLLYSRVLQRKFMWARVSPSAFDSKRT